LLADIDADLDKDEYGDLLQLVNNEIVRLDERLSQIAAEEEAARVAAEEEARRQQNYNNGGSGGVSNSGGGSGSQSGSNSSGPPAGTYSWTNADGNTYYSYSGESYAAFMTRISGFNWTE
jgi:hypothetical protein